MRVFLFQQTWVVRRDTTRSKRHRTYIIVQHRFIDQMPYRSYLSEQARLNKIQFIYRLPAYRQAGRYMKRIESLVANYWQPYIIYLMLIPIRLIKEGERFPLARWDTSFSYHSVINRSCYMLWWKFGVQVGVVDVYSPLAGNNSSATCLHCLRETCSTECAFTLLTLRGR